MKKIITLMLVLSSYNNFVFAETIVHGLQKEVPQAYGISIVITNNESINLEIDVRQPNNVYITKSNHPLENPIMVLSDKLKDSDYRKIYELVRKSGSNFKFLKAPHDLKDGLHFKLTLNINRRQIPVKYFSLSHIRDEFISTHNILSILSNYLPEKEKLLFSKI